MDIAGLYADFRDWPADDSPGSRPVYHIAALAIGGESQRLSDDLGAFEAGDRLGFAPYISRDMIRVARDIALE